MEILLNDELLYIFMHMHLSIFCIILLIILPVASHGQEGWKLKRDKNGISIYVREQEDSSLKEYKARATLPYPLQEVFAFLLDVERHPEWVVRCSEVTIIENQVEHKITYHTVYDMPWPVKDRDLIIESVYKHHVAGKKIESLTKNVQMEFPLEEDVIRMPGYREWVIIEEIDSLNTMFIAEGFADPSGKVPPWLVNMFLVDGIYDSVIKTREILESSK